MSQSLMKSKPRLFAEKREGSAIPKFKGFATRLPSRVNSLSLPLVQKDPVTS